MFLSPLLRCNIIALQNLMWCTCLCLTMHWAILWYLYNNNNNYIIVSSFTTGQLGGLSKVLMEKLCHFDVNILPPSPALNVTAFQHRFNTKSLILLHLAYTFSIHLYSTVLAIAMSSWIHCTPVLL